MDSEVEVRSNALVVRLAGEIDIKVADALRAELETSLDRSRARHLVLNLDRVSFIDSSGLGVILGRYKRVSVQGGKLAFVGLRPAVQRVLELSGVLRISEVFPSEDEALSRLQ
ncbi:anti-sigma F factor antagonist [Desulforudis sp. 1088]|uniref:anti-sigma F factor antagonist n=1 Tax=unclassified Candidatus Desulforudis TaxID=2635950 RepID=UPI00348B68ED